MQRSASDFLRRSGSLLARARSQSRGAASEREFELRARLILMRVENVRRAGCIHATFGESRTRSALVDEVSGVALFADTVMETRVILHKRNVDGDTRFKPRVVKLCVRACGASAAPILADIAFDITSYAHVGPAPRPVRLELSHGVVVVGLLGCSILHAAWARRDSRQGCSGKDRRFWGSLGARGMGRVERSFSFCSRSASRHAVDGWREGWEGYEAREMSWCEREQLMTENRRLKLVLDNMLGRVKVSQSNLMVQNAILRRQIKRLEDTLDREPEVADVVDELKKVRKALVIVSTERDRLRARLVP